MFDPYPMLAVQALDTAFDRALVVDPSTADEQELDDAVMHLQSHRSKLDALEAKWVGEWDARKVWQPMGHLSAAACIASRRRLPIEACRRAPKVARKLRLLPGVQVALEAGTIGAPHVQRIVALDNVRTREALVADHVEITRWAMTLPWRQFCRRLQDWIDEHDPDGLEPKGASPKRRLHCSKTVDDGFVIDGWLDAVGGTIFSTELSRLERLLYEEDMAEARQRLGFEPMAGNLRRTSAQRRADALVEMAQRSAVKPEQKRGGRALFTVLVGDDSLKRICELTNGIELRPGQLVPYLSESMIQRVVFDGPDQVIGISKQRTFRGLLRKAIQVRDRSCQAPLCDEPIDGCEIDHRVPHSAGGTTASWNGRLHCGPHNRGRPGAERPPNDRPPNRAPPNGETP